MSHGNDVFTISSKIVQCHTAFVSGNRVQYIALMEDKGNITLMDFPRYDASFKITIFSNDFQPYDAAMKIVTAQHTTANDSLLILSNTTYCKFLISKMLATLLIELLLKCK